MNLVVTSYSALLVNGVNFGAVADAIANNCLAQNPPFTTAEVQAALVAAEERRTNDTAAALQTALEAERARAAAELATKVAEVEALTAERDTLSAERVALAASLAEHQRLAAEASAKAGAKIAALGATIAAVGATGVDVSGLNAGLSDLVAVAREVSTPVIDRQKAALAAEIAEKQAQLDSLGT